LLASGRPARRDDPHDVAVTFGPDNHDQPAPNRSDRDEAILDVGMVVIEVLEIVDTRAEQLTGLLEGDAVVFLVGKILGTVLGDPHRDSVSQWRSTSMAYHRIGAPPFSQRITA